MFEQSEKETKNFISNVALALNMPDDEQTALKVTTAVFHVLRDILTVEESLHLIDELPLHLKGVYVSGWHLSERKGIRNKENLVDLLRTEHERHGVHELNSDDDVMFRLNAVLGTLNVNIQLLEDQPA